MKYTRIGRYGSPARRKAERDLVRAYGGELYAENGGHRARLAALPDSVPLALGAVPLPEAVFVAIKGRRIH